VQFPPGNWVAPAGRPLADQSDEDAKDTQCRRLPPPSRAGNDRHSRPHVGCCLEWALLRKTKERSRFGVDAARRDQDRRLLDSARAGTVEGFPLGSYTLLVDHTGRLFRGGQAALLRELAAIFDRLGTTAESWWSRLAKLSQGRLFGRVLAATCDWLQEVANRLGVRRLVNLGRCPAR
jgi:hypothetical protein